MELGPGSSAHGASDDGAEHSPDAVEFLDAARRGDEEAWRQIVALYGRRLFALAKSRCGSAELAEEVTQSVFATVARTLGSGGYREQGRFESWLFRIAMNRIRDHARKSARQATSTDPETLSRIADRRKDEGERDEALLQRLRAAMAKLGKADREIVELRHHGEMSFMAMSELLDEPLGTLLARHHRALRKLKSILEDDGGDEGSGS
jgi:RNA polymerase sigma-70 factor (ECF subfamily)